MGEQRHVIRLNRSLVVALPRLVLLHLGVGRGDAVYWTTTRKGEVVLSKRPTRVGGPPEGLSLQRQLVAALEDVARLRLRNEARDRSMYAEGHAHGARQTEERLTSPGGPSSRRGIRRRLYAYGFPRVEEAPLAPRRRRARRPVVAVDLPELDPPYADDFDSQGRVKPRAADATPSPDLPSTSVLSGGDVASEGEAPPGHPQDS